MAKIIGDVAIAVEAETAGLISGLNSGKISVENFGTKVEQMGKRLKRAETQSRSMGGAFRSLGNISNRTRAQIQNASFQIQDIAVQFQGGTKASTALAQQLPQLLGGFGPIGAIVGVLAGVGIPALAFAFENLGGQADELADKMDEVTAAKTKLNEQLRQGNLGVTSEELILMDQLAQKLKEVNALRDRLSQPRVGVSMRASYEAARDELKVMKEQLATFRRLQSARERLVSSTRDMSAAERQVGEGMIVTGRHLTENEAIARLLREGLSASAIEALRLSDVDMVTGVDAAAKAAAKLAANLNISLREALKLKALSADPLDAFGGAGPFVPKDSPAWDYVPPSGGGGGGGGGGGRTGPSESELEAFRRSFASEMELLDIHLADKLKKLDEFRQAKMLKESEYDELEAKARKDHLDKMRALEEKQKAARLQSISGAFGDLASLMQSGNERLFKIGQAAAVADAVVSGYGAAVSAWEKGMKVGGPPVAAAFTAASLAKTGALISSITSASSTGSSAGVSAAATADPSVSGGVTKTAEFKVIGSNVLGLEALVDQINNATDQGYRIRIAS